MRIVILNILIIVIFTVNSFSQGKTEMLQGKVTFVTTNNIYVKFDNTENIEVGDTLMIKTDSLLSNCLVVTNKSSISCVSRKINSCEVKKDEIIYHDSEVRIKKKESIAKFKSSGIKYSSAEVIDSTDINNKEKINGRISAASYSNMNNSNNSTHRTMYRFSLNARNINNSKYSLETYLNYRQNFSSSENSSGQKNNYFNIYNLALRHDFNPQLSVIAGRKINNNASSLGAIDGIQVQKYFGNFYTGIIAGFRPDIFDHSFNSDLLEYGTYFGLKTDNKNLYSKSTLGILEQKNKGKVDRRYTYFQHSSTFNRNLNVFSSFELDLFNQINGKSFNKARLTNLYISTRYRLSKKMNVNLSYDSRKRILYYETLKTELEQLLENDEARQGVRIRVNYRLLKNTSTGISFSQRFQSSSQNKSNNINGFFTLSKIPTLNGLLSVNYNRNISNYLESNITSIRHSRYFINNKLNVSLYYRYVNYKYLSNENNGSKKIYKQNYYGSNFSYNINSKLTFSILGELSDISDDKNYRINTRIIKRFAKK